MTEEKAHKEAFVPKAQFFMQCASSRIYTQSRDTIFLQDCAISDARW